MKLLLGTGDLGFGNGIFSGIGTVSGTGFGGITGVGILLRFGNVFGTCDVSGADVGNGIRIGL